MRRRDIDHLDRGIGDQRRRCRNRPRALWSRAKASRGPGCGSAAAFNAKPGWCDGGVHHHGARHAETGNSEADRLDRVSWALRHRRYPEVPAASRLGFGRAPQNDGDDLIAAARTNRCSGGSLQDRISTGIPNLQLTRHPAKALADMDSKTEPHAATRIRVEDDYLLRGTGRYMADAPLPARPMPASCARRTPAPTSSRSTARRRWR